MRMLRNAMLLSAAVFVLTGCCGVTGAWKLDKMDPATAQGKFQFGKMCLKPDHTYCAEASYGGEAKCMKGTYKYDDAAKTLTFTAEGGKERTYKVEMAGANEMHVSMAGENWKAIMVKTECKCKDGCKGDCKDGKDACKTDKKCDPAKCDPAKCKDAKKAEEPKKDGPKKAEVKKDAKADTKGDAKKADTK